MKDTTIIKTNLLKVNEFQTFAAWLCMPTSEKKKFGLRTQKDFALAYGINEATLSEWKSRKDLWKLVNKDMQEWSKLLTPNVALALYKRAISPNGKPKDTELWLRYFTDFGQKEPEPQTIEPVFSEEDVRALISFLPTRKQKKFYRMFDELIANAQEIRKRQNEASAELDTDIHSCL